MTRNRLWLGAAATLLVFGASNAAWDLDGVRSSVMAWGAGVVDRPLSTGTGDAVLDQRLLFKIDAVGIATPAVLSETLTNHAEWWRTAASASVILERPSDDGVRALQIVVDCMRADHDHRVKLKDDAHPVDCADPAPSRACYHAGRRKRGVEVHLLLTVDRLEDDAVEMHVDVLALGDGATIFRAKGGPLKHLDGHSVIEALQAIAADSHLAPPVYPAESKQWAMRGHAELTTRGGQGLADVHLARRRGGRSFVKRWRETNAHLLHMRPDRKPSAAQIGAPRLGWTTAATHASVKAWGAGALDPATDAQPHDPVTHRRLVFDASEIGIDRPAAISVGLTEHARWWRDATGVTATLGHPYSDGVRPLRFDFEATEFAGARDSIRDLAHPVVCADPAGARTCYHAAFTRGTVAVHLLLTVARVGDDVDLHANALLLIDGGAEFQTPGGPLFELSGWSMTAMLSTLATAKSATAMPAPTAQRWTVEGSATGTLNVERSIALDFPRVFAADASAFERLGAPQQVEYPKRPASASHSTVEAWRAARP